MVLTHLFGHPQLHPHCDACILVDIHHEGWIVDDLWKGDYQPPRQGYQQGEGNVMLIYLNNEK